MKITIENLSFSYGSRKVLRGLSTSFETGKIYGIVGKNGVGKTTFFKTLTNIISNYTGYVAYDDEQVRENPAVLAKTGILLDDIELYKAYSGWFNIKFFAGLRGQLDLELANRLAKNLELTEALDQKVSSYSLGMTRKLLLLISLMNDAEVLIFDEPFRGIDQASVNWFREALLEMKKSGKLILISSHVQEDIEALCDDVLVLSNGEFTDRFDLNDQSQVLTYFVKVNQAESLQELLQSKGIASSRLDQQVRFDIQEAQFQVIFKEAVALEITFDEIKKEAKFAEFVK